MNKTALIQEVSEQFDTISKKDMDKIISCVFEKMIDTLSAGDTLEIAGFGKFIVNERKERMGINPVTMERIRIPVSKYVKFTSSKSLKDLVNK